MVVDSCAALGRDLVLAASLDLIAAAPDCSDLMKKVVPHIIGELNSVRVRRESFISLNIK